VDRGIEHPQRLGVGGGAGALDVFAGVGAAEGIGAALLRLAHAARLGVLAGGDHRAGLAQAVAIVQRGIAGFGADGGGTRFEALFDRRRLRGGDGCESTGDKEDE
jgi:hypothetical protein